MDITPVTVQTNQSKPKSYAKIIWLIVVILALGAAVFLFWQNRNLQNKLKTSSQNQQLTPLQENQALIDRVGQLIVLPTDESPTIATVTDLNKLQGQPFFVNAKVGDKVLIYAKAKKAILYDPEANKIVEVAPLNLPQTASPSSSPASSTP